MATPLDEAIRLDPKDASSFNNRGAVWREKGDFDHAIADFDRAIELNSKVANSYSNRGTVWRAKGDLDRAIVDFDQALRLNPNYADAYANRGLVYEAKGDLSRAEKDFKSAIAAPATFAFSKRYQETAKVRLALLTAADQQPVKQISAVSSVGTPGRRTALVIGNGAYAGPIALPNPPNDARAVANNLRAIGFEVSEGIDLNREDMKRQVNDFVRNAANAKIALLFYAGHGMQIDGKNYLLPIDTRPADTKDLAAEMTDVDTILAGLDDQIRTNIIILDACRDNPLIQKVALASASRSVSVRSGLAAPSGLGKGATIGAGTLLAFATAPGQVALDGDGSNSPFSAALTRHIGTPGLEVQSMLTRVRADVVAATKSKQVPWSNSSLLGEVFLVGQKP